MSSVIWPGIVIVFPCVSKVAVKPGSMVMSRSLESDWSSGGLLAATCSVELPAKIMFVVGLLGGVPSASSLLNSRVPAWIMVL